MRISWEEYFMLIAKLVSTRSTCLKRKVGAVIVRDKRILTTGYNGQIPGQRHCNEPDFQLCYKEYWNDRRFCRAIHAEANAVIQAAKMGISLEGAELYSTLMPCPECVKLIASVGIKRVYYELDYHYDPPNAWYYCEPESGIDFIKLEVSDEALSIAKSALDPYTSKKEVKNDC